MGTRTVTHTRKDADGDIIAICNPKAHWYERSREQVISHIESGEHGYCVRLPGTEPAYIHVVENKKIGKYLRTNWDDTLHNNLDDLPECTIPSEETIRSLAPVVRFHPEEVYMPIDPMPFIRSSRFRHHRSHDKDQGYNHKAGRWETNDSHDKNYYNIPVDFINGYGLHPNGKNRRPRDSNRGKNWNVFLQPKGKPQGKSSPDGIVPTVYFSKNTSSTRHGQNAVLVQYWWFFGYNDGWSRQNHQGDWEHATAVLKHGIFIGAYMASHGSSDFYSAESLQYERGHFVVYSAKGSHASYPKTGSFHLFGVDHTSGGGQSLRTWKRLKSLREQPWKNFSGAWGEVGEFSDTTGPLGPWFKRWSKL